MTLNELQILLALNGNERIEYAEEEIFVSEELYRCYLESLCSKYDWYRYYNTSNRSNKSDLAWLAYSYAKHVIESRWLEAESLIASTPDWAYYYAMTVIKGRFVEAECVIATSAKYAIRYNDAFDTDI